MLAAPEQSGRQQVWAARQNRHQNRGARVFFLFSHPSLRFLAAADYWDEGNGYARGFYLLALHGNLWGPIAM